MKTSDFDYELPEELIAQEPAKRRTDARMLVVNRSEQSLTHARVSEIGEFLSRPDLLVVNNTKVIAARLFGKKAETGGAVEILLLEPLDDGRWVVLCRSSRQPKPGVKLMMADGRIEAEVLAQGEAGRLEVRLIADGPLYEVLDAVGTVPLPPYIKREQDDLHAAEDRERYQTVYAKEPGAVAAPTAGLHFTPELLTQLDRQGVGKVELTLHVGIGTFRPVSADEVAAHQMDEERYELPEAAATAVRRSREQGGRVVAVGSTSVRTLETVWSHHGQICADQGRSDLFIYPPYTFHAVDAMLTNFHLPKSTLIMMVSALAGRDLILQAYHEAVKARYRFYSYGDCMLIL